MTNRLASTRHSGAVLDLILAQPSLVAAVQQLDAATLHALIEHVGLEDCGELVALARREQIAEVFDDDLWTSRAPGEDARFDAKRFALWLDVLVEQGARLAVDKFCELDEDLLTLALSKLVFVIDIDRLAVRMANTVGTDGQAQAEHLEKLLESTLYHELERYRVIARDVDAFDSLLTVLLELDSRDYETLVRLLERCADISNEYIADNGGLIHVLSASELIEEDVAGERDDRRERAGFVAPSAAVAFLALARDASLAELVESDELDPITRSHFRHVETTERPLQPRSRAQQRLLAILRDARVVTPATRRLSRKGSGTTLRRALAILLERHADRHGERVLELAYLGNVMLAAQGMRPVEAAERALELCERGGAYLLERHDVDALAEVLRETSLIKLFRVGFHLTVREGAAHA
jgi:hypothetical protein